MNQNSNQRNDGGAAFPHSYEINCPPADAIPGELYVTSPAQVICHGISVRDYFAAKAPAVPQSFERKCWTEQEVVELGGGHKRLEKVKAQEPIAAHHARWAYEYADAMLAAREKS
jgi:hypothetical protein